MSPKRLLLVSPVPHDSSVHSPSGGGSHAPVGHGSVVAPPPPDELELLELDEDNELDEDELDEGCVLLELEDEVAPEEEELEEDVPWLELDDDEIPEDELDVDEEVGVEELLVLDEEELLKCDELDDELLDVEVELLELVGTLELEELVGGGGVCEELLELVGGGGVCEELLEVEDELLELRG